MPAVLAGDPAHGVALYTGNDDDPLTDPINHLSRLKFHSGLQYPVVVATQTMSITLPTRGVNVVSSTAVHDLDTHGRGAYPLILGAKIVEIDGVATNYPFVGSFPIRHTSLGFGRVITLGCNTTRFLLVESYMSHANRTGHATPAMDITIEVYLCDLDMGGSPPPVGIPTVLMERDGNVLKIADGRFASNKAYIRRGAPGAGFALPRGQTIDIKSGVNTGSGAGSLGEPYGFRYSLAGHVEEATQFSRFISGSETLQDLDSGSFNAAYDDVVFNTPDTSGGFDMIGSPDRIRILSGGGNTVFDTDDEMFHGQFFSGTVAIPSIVVSPSADRDEEDVYELEDVPADFDTVIGMFRFSNNGEGGSIVDDPTDGLGYFIAGGTYMRYFKSGGEGSGSVNFFSGRKAGMTFYCEGGKLKLRHSAYLSAFNASIRFRGGTVSYELFAGTFT